MHLRGVAGSGGRQLGQIFLTLAFLPYDAFISLDAIGRTLLRLLVTHKRLLEWQTSSDSERTTRADLAGFYATMWIAPGRAGWADSCWSCSAGQLPLWRCRSLASGWRLRGSPGGSASPLNPRRRI
jgi:cyclic beta-1,2-glucan synthetase